MDETKSRLGKQIEEVIATLGKVGARFALIGGLALAPYKVVRATQQIICETTNAWTSCTHIDPPHGNFCGRPTRWTLPSALSM